MAYSSAMFARKLERQRENFNAAFSMLHEAVRREDALAYLDPPPWMQPVRLALGGLLLEQGLGDEAERVIQEIVWLATDFPRCKSEAE